jgi:uncharacterized membrane protein
MQFELLLLRLIHIMGGTFWVGSGIFTTFILMPALGQNRELMVQVAGGLQRRKIFVILPTVALLTILSGLRLMVLTSAGAESVYFASRMGRTFAASGALAVISFLASVAIARPATVRMAKLSQSAASDEISRQRIAEEIQKLQRRTMMSSLFAVVLLLLAAAGMAVARYL